ncbi:MAG: hypothetical protein ABIN36_13830 [Ferruginibacter sp.]
MKQLIFFAFILLFISCKKEINEKEVSETSNAAGGLLHSRDVQPVPAPSYEWTNLPGSLPAPPYNVDGLNMVMAADGKVYCIRGFSYDRELYKLNTSTMKWAPSADFTFDDFRQYIFSYQSKIYMGFTQAAQTIFAGMESIDVNTGTRTTVAPFPGTPVSAFTSFVIGDKGYLLGGAALGGTIVNQFWEYNFITNVWTNKGSSPLGSRAGAFAFVSDGKAYFGGGYTYINLNGSQVKLYKKDWLQFTPGSVFIVTKADFPGTARTAATGFVPGGVIYLGFGYNSSNIALKDFWQYSPYFNSWHQMPSWPGTLTTKNVFGGFSLGTIGYIVKGELAEFWKFRAGYF